mgnify:CR=1 FL=1
MFSFNINAEIEYISKEALEPFAEKHDIVCDDTFYKLINNFAHIYESNRTYGEDRPNIKRTKRTLKRISSKAEQLINIINNLNKHEKTWLLRAHIEVERKASSPQGLKPDESKTIEINGNPIHMQGTENGGHIFKYLEPDDITAALNTLHMYAQDGLEDLPSGKDGRKNLHGLYMLVKNIRLYLIDTLERTFTYEEHNSEGLTPAYQFSSDLIKLINPSVTPTQIKSQMRKVISEANEANKNPKNSVTFDIKFR